MTKDYYENSASLGYWIRESQVRKGAATTAAKLAAKFGFEQLKLQRLEIMIMPENTRSHFTPVKMGAKKEGLLRNKWIINGTSQDVILYSLIPQDLK